MTNRTRILVAALSAASIAGAAACSRESGRVPARDARPLDTALVGAGASEPPLANDDYVGLRYESLPAGVTYRSGTVLSAARGGGDFDLAHVTTPRGEMIWLDSLARAGARPARVVRAVLRLPPLARDERLFMASCDVNGVLDGRVVAIVVAEPGASRFTNIRQAWRVSAARRRFDVIPVGGVTCEEPGG